MQTLSIFLVFLIVSNTYISSEVEKSNILTGINECISVTYETTAVVSFPLCLGFSEIDIKRGLTYTAMINARGYDPGCRSIHHLLWMMESAIPDSTLHSTYVDVGAYIGSCVFHMASMGYYVEAIEPFPDFNSVMEATLTLNPTFKHFVSFHQVLLGSQERYITGNFWHSPTNWPNTGFNPTSDGSYKVREFPLEDVVGNLAVSLVKLKCVGCEYSVLKGAERLLASQRFPIIRMSFEPKTHESHNDVLLLLNTSGYVLVPDIFPTLHLLHGKLDTTTFPVDHLFGSKRFHLPVNASALDEAARKILCSPIDLMNFNLREYGQRHTDVVAIANGLYRKLVEHFLGKDSQCVLVGWHAHIHSKIGMDAVREGALKSSKK